VDADPTLVTYSATSTPPCPESFAPVSAKTVINSIMAPATAKVSPATLRQVKNENSVRIYLS
jgi:hypothetical protein